MQILSNVALALAALLVEAAAGYPDRVYRRIGHPVIWAGALIGWLDTRLNSPTRSEHQRRLLGLVSLGVVLAVTAAVTLPFQRIAQTNPAGCIVLVLASSALLAQRSLETHVRAVADALERNGLAAGRAAVSKIVGRDPDALDEAGVARAAIESLAENFSDGVVAPAFWMAVAGLPGAALYKAANTADSMIGHRTPRHEAFGWAAARFDDAINLPASRLAALCIGVAALVIGESAGDAARAVFRDAPRHRSPNAGWPEAAMAGALGLRLAGPRVYDGVTVEDAFMGHGRRTATSADIRRALRLFRVARMVPWALLAAAVLVGRTIGGR
jgi:adenosylcobinamide-phosphate synthase